MLVFTAGILLALMFVFCGGFLWFMIRFKRQRDFAAHIQEAVTVEELDLEGRIAAINSKLDALTAVCLELKERFESIEHRTGLVLSRNARPSSEPAAYDMVRKGFERGKKVTELARQFGRSKGEIELILNLGQIRKEG
jgi:hypothetical protein